MVDNSTIRRIVGENREGLFAFAQKMVQTLSPSGAEGDVAALVRDEMERLGYDRAWIDEAGNAVGLVAGGDGPSLMFNGHLDHVDAGDPARWPHSPFGGEIHDGELWGRGSVDMKGAVAAMVYAVGLVKALGLTPPGDLYVSGVVQEEVGGLGARHLAATLPVDRAVIGESSSNQLRLGHRGRVELRAVFEGRSVHASMPDLGINPLYSLARFLDGLLALSMASHPDYGLSTVAPTRIESEPQSSNVTPGTLRLALDWRNVPGEDADQIVAKLEALLARSLQGGCRGRIEVGHRELQTYTGLRMSYPDAFGSFTTPADDPWLLDARAALVAALDREVELGIWRFATDGAHFAAAGTTVLGLGPGDDTVVHTVQERLPLGQLVESAVAYLTLALLP